MKISNIYILLLAAFVIAACDPLKDINSELEKNSGYSNDITYIVTEDDYDFLELDGPSFENEDQAKSLIPAVLIENFPALGKGSSAKVGYNQVSPTLENGTAYTVTAEEYDALGFTYGNFSDLEKDLPKYAEFKVPDPSNGDYLDVTHAFYDGSFNPALLSRVVYTAAFGWKYASILADDVYGDFFGESGIDFSDQEEGAEKMPVYLNYLQSSSNTYNALLAEEGEIRLIQYNFDNRCFDPDCVDPGEPNVPAVALYVFSGGLWASSAGESTLSFGHDGTVWVPDNTIKYTLTAADFDAIANNEDLGDAGARENLDTYGNFNLSNWTNAYIIEAISFVLNKNFPASEVGQKYLVTYSTYPLGDLQSHVILIDTGEYIELEE